MLKFIKQVFFVLLSFSSSLAYDQTKYCFLNDEPCMIRPTLIDLSPVELTYYPFIISLGKFSGSCNVVLPKIFVPKETKIKTLKHLIHCQIKVRLKQWQHIFHVIVNANSAMQYLIKSIME